VVLTKNCEKIQQQELGWSTKSVGYSNVHALAVLFRENDNIV